MLKATAMNKRFVCLALLLLLVTSCTAKVPAVGPTPPPVATTAEPLPQPSPSPTSAVSPTPPPPPPSPTFPADSTPILITPVPTTSAGEDSTPVVNAIQEPLLIDGERRWIVAQGQVNTEPKTVVLATADGRLLTSYDTTGKPALDRTRNQTIIDTGDNGLVVLDMESGLELARLDLPAAEEYAAPQADPESGLIYAFRGSDIHILDPVRLGNSQLIASGIEHNVCNEPGGSAPIVRSDYDLINHRLYLTFLTAVCTPWSSMTLVAYDTTAEGTLTEVGRLDADPDYQAVVFLDQVYGMSVSRLGPTSFWAWDRGATPWFLETEEYGGAAAGIVADWGRQLIYESIGGRVRVIDPTTRRAIHEVEIPLLADGGRLAGHDPISDQVYLLTASGQLQPLVAERLTEQAIIIPPEEETQQETAVIALAVSPSWLLDQTMAGLWENGDCPVEGGLLYLLRPDRGWFRSAVSEAGDCEAIGAFAFTPIIGVTGELFAADNRLGVVFKSADFGQTWQQVGATLLEAGRFRQLLVSPAYGLTADRTLFAHADNGAIFRSQDSGQSWQRLDIQLEQLAMSAEYGAEYDEDGVLIGARNIELYISRDQGDSWQLIGRTPGGEPLTMLSIAPLFEQWQTLFAFSAGGNFYRSLDGGTTWELAISTSPADRVQIVYAADIEANRPIFLLHDGSLDASYDGWNSTWPAPTLPPTVTSPVTSLAISPNFAEDGTLFFGTADGQVISLDAGLPE